MENRIKTILDVLLQSNRLSQTEASSFSMNLTNAEIEQILRKQGLVSSEDIAKAYSEIYNLPIVNLKNQHIEMDVFNLIPKNLIEKYQIVAFDKTGKIGPSKIKLALGKPANLNQNTNEIVNYLKNNKNIIAELYITTPEDIETTINHFQVQTTPNKPSEPIDSPKGNKPIDSSLYHLPGVKTVDLKLIRIPYEVISKFPIEISKKYNIVVFENPSPNLIKVAVSDPFNQKVREILDFVKVKNEINILEFVASPAEINDAINLYYRRPGEEKPKPQEVKIDTTKESVQPKTPNVPATNAKQDIPKPNFTVPQKPHPAPVAQPAVQNKTQNQDAMNEEMAQQPEDNNLDRFLGEQIKNIEQLQKYANQGDVPRILAAIVSLAVSKKASDVHIEAEEKDVRVRFRIDGMLQEILKLQVGIGPALISRVKILSRLQIDEQRVPQDGRFDVETGGHQIDLRVSTLPTVHGEKAALRLLDKTQSIFNLEDIGMAGRGLKLVEENITKPYGIILVTGPTGSGKSTTLYSILQKISNPKINVITLEDPVEYEIPGINQCQIKPKIGFSFAEGLRSVLRQDPNIVMVGEIRDAETANMATHAALTGHLVLTTLHTNDAAGALPRLMNMGVEPFLITSSINVIIAQRLVRKLCEKCRAEAKIPEQTLKDIENELQKFNMPKPYKFYEAKGCSECTLGYKGRIGIYEVMGMTDEIEDIAVRKRPTSEIAKAAIAAGMVTLKQDGLIKAVKGITTVSEVLRVTLNG